MRDSPGSSSRCKASSPIFAAQAADLQQLHAACRLRKLSPRAGQDFSSNDYLGLAGSPQLADAVRKAVMREVPVGSGGSRLLRGNHDEHERLEHEAAAFFGSESALFFSSGYAANSTLLSTLPQRGDLVIHDALIHASAHEGLRLSRAERLSAHHNDPSHVEELARGWRNSGGKGRIWILAESLYSMDGDKAPLAELAVLADRLEAVLVVDEAHATGVFGLGGRGLAECLDGRENVITLHTCGKGLGCEGALICGPRIVKEFLVNRGRGFIFTTAPSPLMAAAVRASLQIVAAGSKLREQLSERVALAQDLAAGLGFPRSQSQIVPFILGDDSRTMVVAAGLQEAGFDVRGIRPPTVPRGTSRLRISITLNVRNAEIEGLFRTLGTLV
jgi:8-amino-7-oxononanoate synthase